jgi:hypothetical protein
MKNLSLFPVFSMLVLFFSLGNFPLTPPLVFYISFQSMEASIAAFRIFTIWSFWHGQNPRYCMVFDSVFLVNTWFLGYQSWRYLAIFFLYIYIYIYIYIVFYTFCSTGSWFFFFNGWLLLGAIGGEAVTCGYSPIKILNCSKLACVQECVDKYGDFINGACIGIDSCCCRVISPWEAAPVVWF